MTEQEAVLIIQAIPEKIWNQMSKAKEDAISMAYKALEKQIPKKPIRKEGFMVVHRCPECNEVLPICQPCCGKCGQAIDWSEEE